MKYKLLNVFIQSLHLSFLIRKSIEELKLITRFALARCTCSFLPWTRASLHPFTILFRILQHFVNPFDGDTPRQAMYIPYCEKL